MLKKINGQFSKKLSAIVIGVAALSIVLFGVVLPSTVLGVSTVTIRGNVNKVVPGPSLVGVANQPVTVVCGGVTKNVTTNSSGLYTAVFMEAGCNPFSAVSSKSTYNASILTRQVWVSSEGRATADLNF